ncbi:MAG: AI-2E family transporter [Pseudomonadota bacterium]
MTVGEQLRWWGLGLFVTLVLLWFLSEPLLPFILGATIAYLADPAADRLEAMGMSRLAATVSLSVGLAFVFFCAALVLVPAVIDQVRSFVANAPALIEGAQSFIATFAPAAEGSEANSLLERMSAILQDKAETWSGRVLENVWLGGLAVIDFVTIAVITPVVGFYLLHDWDRIMAALDDLAPRQHQSTLRHLALELDDVLAGFVRGQMTVCAILGSFYALALVAVGLQFGLLVGIFAGLISFIPFIGSILGGVISIGIAVSQFWGDPQWIAVVAIIFAIGQVVEGNYLTPKLVGGHVKLHPVWLMLALSVFGALMGFVGMLIAVPAAAAIGVLARFLVGQYRAGRLYRGDPAWRAAMARAAALEAREDTADQGPAQTLQAGGGSAAGGASGGSSGGAAGGGAA